MAYIVAIGAYLVLLMIFGLIVAHKKVKTSDDMVTGGHRILASFPAPYRRFFASQAFPVRFRVFW